jgi:hypothetical protein
MGSWDETCGLTGLPIRVGDPVYLQIIAENWCPNHGYKYIRNSVYHQQKLKF